MSSKRDITEKRSILRERYLELVIGNWTGSGITRTHILKIQGENIDDSAIADAFKKSNQEFGYDLFDAFSGPYDDEFPGEVYDKIAESGFKDKSDYGNLDPYVIGGKHDGERINALSLFIWWFGRNIRGFSCEDIGTSVLLGANSAILNRVNNEFQTYGSGLFVDDR